MPLQLTLLHRQCARHEMADRWTTTLLPLFKRQGVASLSWTALRRDNAVFEASVVLRQFVAAEPDLHGFAVMALARTEGDGAG
mmetsp:Transcript_132305/g.423264  ORF Transcript_132305/g.423264 Transcript_132305/m.423264 type:complete len:83 (-) Transcript_132305:126-374(-)